MIDYTLAKRLKESGFPQDGVSTFVDEREANIYIATHNGLAKISPDSKYEKMPKVPTLSELIEECRKELDEIVIYIIDDLVEVKGVNPTYGWDLVVQGSTPDIAVANLYIALNEKK